MQKIFIFVLFVGILAFISCSQSVKLPDIKVNVPSISFGKLQEANPNPATAYITLEKVGDGVVQWSARCDDPWILVTPSSGVLTDNSCELYVSLNTASLKAGDYKTNVELTNLNSVKNKILVPVSFTIAKPTPPLTASPVKESVPDNSYVQVSSDVGYFGGGVNLKCFYMISVHNKHETYSLRDVKLVLTDSMQEYSIADLIKPFDTATFNKPSLPCSQYFVTWTWQPPAPPKLQASTLPGSAVADLATPSWPMSQHDLRHTGMSPYVGSQTNEVKWSYVTNSHAIQAGNQSVSSPVIGSDGTVYVGSNDKNLYAINPDGSKKWAYLTGDIVRSSPAIGSDGTIYVGSENGKLYAIDPGGSLKWFYAIDSPLNWIEYSPTIGSDGTIYVGSWDDNLYAINPNGSLKWSYRTGGSVRSSPAIGNDGTVYVGSNDDKFYAINPNGSLKWSYRTGGFVCSSPAIGSDGTIYVGSEDNKLYAINPDGTLKWSYVAGNGVVSSPAIGKDGTVYVGSWDYNLYAIDPGGTLKWSYATDGPIYSSPAIGSDGIVYVGSNDKNLYAFRGPTFISSCNPIEGAQGHMLTDVIITGINFTGATNISFGEGITISSFTVNSATQITASISITPEAIPGSRVVSITTPGGTGTLPDGFTVQRTDRIDPVVLYIIGALILCALAGGVIFMTTRRKQRPNI